MLNIKSLLKLADEFDRLGHVDLANNITEILRVVNANDIKINYENDLSRPYDKEEEQRRIAIEFKHLYKMYLDVLPKIDYLKPFFDTIKGALETAKLIIEQHIAEKTPAFDFTKFRSFFDNLNQTRDKILDLQAQNMTSTRVLLERQMILAPLKDLRQRMGSLYKDDADLEAIETQLGNLLNVFDNIFDQTVGQIANVPLARE